MTQKLDLPQTSERLLLTHEKTPGFLASGREEFNLGPEDEAWLLRAFVQLSFIKA